MLRIDEETLLLAAAENKIKAWGLLNEHRHAKRYIVDLSTLEPPEIVEQRTWHPMFVPMSKFAAGDVLKYGQGKVSLLTEEDKHGTVWSDEEETPAYIPRHAVFFQRIDINSLLANEHKTTNVITAPTTSNPNISDKLAILNQTATRFWANADRNERSTHPTNSDVIEWLVQRGYTQTLAEKAATIIRPDWAPTGRKPDE